MKMRMFQAMVTVIACVAVVCSTGLAWADLAGVQAKIAGMGGGSNMPAGTSSGRTVGSSGSTGVGRSSGSVGSGRSIGGSTLSKLSGLARSSTGVSGGIGAGMSAGSVNRFTATHTVSSTGISRIGTANTDTGNVRKDTVNLDGTVIHNPEITGATATMTPVQKSLQKTFGENQPNVVKQFGNMSKSQQMEMLSYGNSSIWHYQETANQVDANGQPVWQPSLNVLGDIWGGMSQEGQYTDKDGNIITNSPFGTNGVGQPENNMITPGEGFTWNDVKAAAYEWCAKNNVNTSCGLQETQFNKMQYDLEAAGIIDMVNPQEMQSYLTNTGNTRANAEAFVNGQEVTPSASSGSWIGVNTDSFLGKMGTAGNSPWDTSESVNNDGVFVPSTIYINANASDAYVQQTFNEAWDLYGKGSCYTGRQLKMAVLNYMKSKGAIGWNEYFN